MTARRIADPRGKASRQLRFCFDGRDYQGMEGDTIASALLASNVSIVARSFKYHRPRGIWGSWVEEPNAIFDIRHAGHYVPNVRGTTEALLDGMEVRSVNASPSAEQDRYAFLDKLAPFIPAAFYYKTFMWPDWHRFEPRIRQMAGLGRVDPDHVPTGSAPHISMHCDVLVIGAGPAGLAAAAEAARTGRQVILADDRGRPGGSLLDNEEPVEGQEAGDWIGSQEEAIRQAGATLLCNTTAFGIYDHGLVCLNRRIGFGQPDHLLRIRARQIVLAAGAIERPLPHDNNDRPGVMSAAAAGAYLGRHGVLCGERIVLATNHDGAYAIARKLQAAGAAVTVLDSRPQAAAMDDITVHAGEWPVNVAGKSGIRGVTTQRRHLECDLLAVSGGWNPSVHLHCQAGGTLRWQEEIAAFVPERPANGVVAIGAANGTFGADAAAAEGRSLFANSPADAPQRPAYGIRPFWASAQSGGRIWIDFQNDVTAKDIGIAARENFRSVEHLKRYTTLGMATDQGKTSNVSGLAAMAAFTGRTIEEVGTTTFRPPFVPVPLATLAGWRGGEFMNPVRRLPLENVHRENGATFREYGGWLRPAWFGSKAPAVEIAREARHAREHGAIFDSSTLGKIEVIGPDAADFFDFQYYQTMSTLAPGRIRYGFMLTEGGIVYDDGVLARIDRNRFIVSCSSSHVAGVHARLEAWRQDIFDPHRIQIHDATAQWVTLTATGPGARQLIEALELGIDANMPHMSIVQGKFEGGPARVARVSFSGDRSYELSVPAGQAEALWSRMKDAGEALGMIPIGLEAMSLLRAEKGFVIIGKDTDGTTMPHDLGVAAPRERKHGEYIGKRSLFTAAAEDPDRRQLVGLAVGENEAPLMTGAHVIERRDGRVRSLGYVTSSYDSPNLARPVALGLVENGRARLDEEISIYHLGEERRARIVAACAYDPENRRLDL